VFVSLWLQALRVPLGCPGSGPCFHFVFSSRSGRVCGGGGRQLCSFCRTVGVFTVLTLPSSVHIPVLFCPLQVPAVEVTSTSYSRRAWECGVPAVDPKFSWQLWFYRSTFSRCCIPWEFLSVEGARILYTSQNAAARSWGLPYGLGLRLVRTNGSRRSSSGSSSCFTRRNSPGAGPCCAVHAGAESPLAPVLLRG